MQAAFTPCAVSASLRANQVKLEKSACHGNVLQQRRTSKEANRRQHAWFEMNRPPTLAASKERPPCAGRVKSKRLRFAEPLFSWLRRGLP